MVVAAFPIAKLAALALRQISKPLATRIKNGAKSHPIFRTYICMPPAQLYHWIEVNIKMRMLNLGKPAEVPKLNESMAIDLGAELLGEGIIFAVAAACLVAEYRRSSKKEREKEEQREDRTQELERKITDLEFRLAEQETRLRELDRMTFSINSSVADWWRGRPDYNEVPKSLTVTPPLPENPTMVLPVPPSANIINRALDEVDRAVKGKQG